MAKYTHSSAMMDELLEAGHGLVSLPEPGTLVEGEVVAIHKNQVLVDLGDMATGIIAGREAHDSLGTLETLNVGDQVSAFVIEEANEDGLVVLSLRRASQQKSWQKFVKAYEEDEVIEVKASEANKGGLLLNIDGIKGFIPVSQLAPLHYPRVANADSNLILQRLKDLVGIPLTVKVLNLDRDGGKLILSEKAAESEKRKKSLQKLDIGQEVEGTVSGVVKFGIFVTLDGGVEGLVHISEIAWGHVRDPNEYAKLGDRIKVLVIGKQGDKISFSMKQRTPDPWIEASKKYTVDTVIDATIDKVTPFGIFVKLDETINGLIHISEITDEKDANSVLSDMGLGQSVKAKVITVDPEERRIGLSIKALSESSADVKKKDSKKAEDSETNKEDKKSEVKNDSEDESSEEKSD